jgi:hypothetical protein
MEIRLQFRIQELDYMVSMKEHRVLVLMLMVLLSSASLVEVVSLLMEIMVLFTLAIGLIVTILKVMGSLIIQKLFLLEKMKIPEL